MYDIQYRIINKAEKNQNTENLDSYHKLWVNVDK